MLMLLDIYRLPVVMIIIKCSAALGVLPIRGKGMQLIFRCGSHTISQSNRYAIYDDKFSGS